jgi:hypothetical protein
LVAALNGKGSRNGDKIGALSIPDVDELCRECRIAAGIRGFPSAHQLFIGIAIEISAHFSQVHHCYGTATTIGSHRVDGCRNRVGTFKIQGGRRYECGFGEVGSPIVCSGTSSGHTTGRNGEGDDTLAVATIAGIGSYRTTDANRAASRAGADGTAKSCQGDVAAGWQHRRVATQVIDLATVGGRGRHRCGPLIRSGANTGKAASGSGKSKGLLTAAAAQVYNRACRAINRNRATIIGGCNRTSHSGRVDIGAAGQVCGVTTQINEIPTIAKYWCCGLLPVESTGTSTAQSASGSCKGEYLASATSSRVGNGARRTADADRTTLVAGSNGPSKIGRGYVGTIGQNHRIAPWYVDGLPTIGKDRRSRADRNALGTVSNRSAVEKQRIGSGKICATAVATNV